MTIAFYPPSLVFPDQSAVRWTSFTKIMRRPEENWPVQIYQRRIIFGQVGSRSLALIADPEAARTVLTGSEGEFRKWLIYEHVVGVSAGRKSLAASSGERSVRLRHAFAPMFKPEVVDRLIPVFRRGAEFAMASWRAQGGVIKIDASLEMIRLTMSIVWSVMFGADGEQPPRLVAEAAAAIHAAQLRDDINAPAIKIAELADAVSHRPARDGLISSNPFNGWTAEMPSGCLSAQELYDNARNFLIAGYETTALTLTWALWLVAMHSPTQRQLHDEIDRVVGAEVIDESHLPRLVFTTQVLNETMRLFPPSLMTVRQAQGAVTLAGENLPPGTVLVICLYALHRHHALWHEGHRFMPDRFAPSSEEPVHRYAYLPFSAGRNGCIGAALAMRELTTLLAMILQHFRVTTNATEVRPRVSITLRPGRDVPLTLHARR